MVLMLLGACVVGDPDPEDPAAELGEEEWWDEGPLAEDEASDAEESVEDPGAIFAPPRFQLPFACGQTWAGQTRTNHSPQRSIDFNRTGDEGDPVVAAAAGRVTYIGTGIPGLGKLVVIKHDNGFITVYAHNRDIVVKEQQAVTRGQKIAELGASDADRPKLHFQIRKGSAAVDPMRYLPAL